jgi:hypothetical protein
LTAPALRHAKSLSSFCWIEKLHEQLPSNKTDGSESLFGEVIFSYTRAQAIADRVLIDVTPTGSSDHNRFPADF